MFEDLSVTEGYFAMRRWTHPSPGPVRIGTDAHQLRGIDGDGSAQVMNCPANVGGSVGGGVSILALIDRCLVENDRRMAGCDARLRRPTIVPRLARLVRRSLPGVALPDAARPASATVRPSGAR